MTTIKLRRPATTYMKLWRTFMEKYGDDADLESKLEKTMTAYDGLGLPESAIEIIRKEEARKIANCCKEKLIPKKQAIDDIDSGISSLGYTTEQQEFYARVELVERFEFTVISLAIFKKKYGIV